ncbi:sugar transferase [Priestia megaterium]|uniref:sugar transferase n=1 Tax=Priestia megaterium TaxID=1404 RepID=UPI0024078A1D|nr:sugar transferase [Priestia megaterium]MED3866662.1 sugar transferase [Priestia megaterium]MED4098118.1 sugar transferase [Priestia megaterium]MED4141595.1 sugar transferase [Priestia megaterium]MED4169244.1 sugar transferase [Priestia megaterium]MED4198958.1 sugar transferase [Priestia megaterium]
MKRVMDLVTSLTLLTLFSPVMLFTAILVRLKMGAPVLFKQQRPGKDGKPFYLYKFRTMANLEDKQGNLLSDQVRLTGTGKFLRKYSLDELPQLINVVKGDMSLVGPRPLLMEYLSLYTEEQMLRHNVRPGITGWAQVNGRNAITWEEKFKLDTWYVRNQSMFLDFKILLFTVFKVVKKEGITQQGHITIEKFKGTKDVI